MCRADYWKSQARKYCDFCKCWIADNKPSIQFHETGKRHKENVAQKLAQLTKRSVKEHNESVKVDEQMRKMEEAALKAYMKDMESNPDYTSQLIVDRIEEKKKQIELQQQDRNEIVNDEEKKKASKAEPSLDSVENSTESESRVWYEAKSDEDYTYYWNYLTGESVWEPPKEGYVSLEEQNSVKGSDNIDTSIPVEGKSTEGENDGKKAANNKKRKEKIDEGEIKKDHNEETPAIGPTMKPDPYGGWTTVDRRIPEPVDLQLPEQEYVEIKVPVMEAEQPQIKFKEKTITTLGSEEQGPSTFKKRKFNSNKGNIRRKFDDEYE